MNPFSLEYLFSPKSIAVIGASRREESVGHAVFRNLLLSGYTGVLYPVNPKSESILGVKTYASVLDIPDSVDLAMIIVPAEVCVAAFQQCVQKKVKAAIVISAGFKEIGKEGAVLERGLVALALEHNIPLLGPNCLGLLNTDPNVMLNASFARTMAKRGNIAFVSQSGALGTAVLDYAKGVNIGFSKFISMGNKACVSELEILDYLAKDSQTDLILMYLEDLSNARELIELCRRVSGDNEHKKPILAIKSGRTLQGAKAASSHTGSLAGSDEVYDAIFAQGGILRVDTVNELFDYARAFSVKELPKGNRVAIVTNAGGPGIMATDACVRYGLTMAQLSKKTQEKLHTSLPKAAGFNNPVDVLGDAQHERYEATLKMVLKDSQTDAAIVILTPQAMTDIEQIAEVIGKVSSKNKKPILGCFMGIVDVSAGVAILEKWKVPHYRFPESAAKALAAMARYTAWVNRPRTKYVEYQVSREKVRQVIQNATSAKRLVLSDVDVFEILSAYGFPILPHVKVKTSQAAAEAAQTMGYPVALKVSSQDIIHKVDVGGVRLHLRSKSEVTKAFESMMLGIRKKMPEARISGILVQKMAERGREVILGVKRDPQFGHILMFGLGGTYVEVMKDVTFRLAPVRELGAHNMIHSIRSFKILEGVRGEKPADIDKIAECLLKLSQLVTENPEIEELDINPLMAYDKGKGCYVVDARILLNPVVRQEQMTLQEK